MIDLSAAKAHGDSPVIAFGRNRATVIVALLIMFGCYLSLQREGNDWGGDFALYIMHARNIANLHSYADTPFLYTPEALQSPQTYPPMLPLLLAPVFRIFGLNYAAFKAEMVALLMLSLWPVYCLARRRTPDTSFWLVLLIGLSVPWLFLKDHISSEAPYLFF